MLTRRTFLGSAFAAAVAGPVASQVLGSSRRAYAASSLPLTVVNNTGRYANSSILIYVVGTDLATGRQAYVKPDGTMQHVSLSDNGSDGYAHLGIPMGGGDTTVTLPQMSGRVYVSIDAEIKFKVVTDGNGNAALQYPAGWVSGDPSFDVLHDCAEFTLNGSGMFCNVTFVDMFSIPMEIQLSGSQNQSAGALKSGGRDAVFSAVSAASGFGGLVLAGGKRVVAPGHGIDAGIFSGSYYDGYIDEVWSKYAGTDLRVNTNAGTFTGRVNGGQFTFSGGVQSFNRPTTRDVFYCDGALVSPNDGITGPVGAVLGAGFNRSTLRDFTDQPTTNAGDFYRQEVTNHYSAAIHASTVDGKAYGFAYDDVAEYASYIQDTNPSSARLVLTPF